MSRTASPGTGKPYGMQRVCRLFGLARSTAYYLKARGAVPPEQRPVPRKRGPVGPCSDGELVKARGAVPPEQRPVPRKRGPVGPCSDGELVGHIRRVLAESPFHGEGYRKVWARLRHRGLRTSQERVRRLMRQHGLQAPLRGGNPHGPRAHDGTITTERPDQMWGTDMTTTVTTEEGLIHAFVAVDHCTCECVGLHAAKSGDRFEALEPIRQGVREHFDGFEKGIAGGLAIRHDHGSAYMSHDFRQELEFLGMTSSPSFVREPEGNGCAERFIRILKENPLRVRTFATLEGLVEALGEFKRTYNEQWLIGRHGHRPPGQVGRDFVDGLAAAA